MLQFILYFRYFTYGYSDFFFKLFLTLLSQMTLFLYCSTQCPFLNIYFCISRLSMLWEPLQRTVLPIHHTLRPVRNYLLVLPICTAMFNLRLLPYFFSLSSHFNSCSILLLSSSFFSYFPQFFYSFSPSYVRSLFIFYFLVPLRCGLRVSNSKARSILQSIYSHLVFWQSESNKLFPVLVHYSATSLTPKYYLFSSFAEVVPSDAFFHILSL